ncbi:MAG: hypothetical protein PHR20_04425 [Bacteroidales bacterium]|nr:hypothetical protein [Bacteroidales bacterium]
MKYDKFVKKLLLVSCATLLLAAFSGCSATNGITTAANSSYKDDGRTINHCSSRSRRNASSNMSSVQGKTDPVSKDYTFRKVRFKYIYPK